VVPRAGLEPEMIGDIPRKIPSFSVLTVFGVFFAG